MQKYNVLIAAISVFYKPYESQGQAWPLTFVRLIWGVVIFLVFMIGIFILKKSYLSTLLAPLLLGTLLWSWYIHTTFKPLSKFVSLNSVFEVERGEETADVVRLRAGHPVTWSQRYAP
jgi:calcium permeable stress-gated cation channel